MNEKQSVAVAAVVIAVIVAASVAVTIRQAPTPVLEFSGIGIVFFSALAALLYILRRRRR